MRYVAAACGGELLIGSPDALVGRVCSDSRQSRADDLFIALAGEKFDGHVFVADVVRKGTAAVMIERAKMPAALPGPCAVIAVDNTRQALGRLAARYRADFDLPVVAVGGSNGKTSAKELLASVLRQRSKTLWSEASFNNDIGVPITLLNLEKTHQAAVLEAGTNHPGELAPLVKMIQPKFGVITSIGREHLEFFGDLAGVAREEGSLAEALPVEGQLFVIGTSEWTDGIARRSRAKVARVGLAEHCDWRARSVRMDGQGMSFWVDGPKVELAGEYRIQLLGRHQVANALFAVAVGAELGLSASEIRRGLIECKPAKMRLQIENWNGVCVLNDAYNANADSVLMALQTLREMPCAGRRVAVLGDMAELGAQAVAAHEEIARKAAEMGINQLFAVGKMAGVIAGAARAAEMKQVIEFEDVKSAAAALKQFLKAGDVVLFKASRAARLESLIEAWQTEEAKA